MTDPTDAETDAALMVLYGGTMVTKHDRDRTRAALQAALTERVSTTEAALADAQRELALKHDAWDAKDAARANAAEAALADAHEETVRWTQASTFTTEYVDGLKADLDAQIEAAKVREAALAESRGELKDLRDLVLAYKAERDADEWGDDEALLARQMYARQRLFRAAAGSPDA